MKLRSLHLQNILSHADTKFELQHLTCFRGDNGAGKSTIVASLQAMYTGAADYTDARGSGIQSMLRMGQDKGSIVAEIEDGGDLRKVRCGITEKSGRSMTCKKDSDAGYTGSDYLAMLAMKKDVLACLVNGHHFFDKKEADQKELLASIILPYTVEFEPWVWPAIAEVGINGQIKRDQKPFDLISACYDAAYKERTAINRALKDWSAPEKPAGGGLAVEDVRKRLAERQQARTDAAVLRQKVIGAWEAATAKHEGLAKRVEQLSAKIASESARLTEVKSGILSKAAIKAYEVTAANEAKKLDAEIATVKAQWEAESRGKEHFAQVGGDGGCPTCRRKMSGDLIDTVIDGFVERMNDLAEKEDALLRQRKELGDWEGAKKAIAAHIQAEKDADLVEKHIAEVEADRMAAATAAEEPILEKPDTSIADAAIADLDRRIEAGNAALQEAIKADILRKSYDTAVEAKAQLDKKQATLDKLVDYFGPKGIQAKLLDESIGPFETAMNAVLAGWGFACHLSFSPYSFGVRFAGKNSVYPLKTISVSQRLMFTVAFQVALAKATGFNFVVVDAADTLLDANRSQLYRNLMAAKLDQVIVLQSDARREIPKQKDGSPMPDTAFYMLSLDKSGDVPTTVCEKL